MPILAHVLLKVSAGSLSLAATDLDLAIEDGLPVGAHEDGAIALPAKSLFDVVKALPAGEMTLSLRDNNRVEVRGGKAQFKLVGIAAQEFPALPTASVSEWIELPAKELARMIDCTLFCVSTDDARYNLTGVYWEPVDGGRTLRFVATDGHRLAMIDRVMDAPAKGRPAIVPKRTLIELRRVLGAAGAEKAVVQCGFSDNHAVFRVGEVTITSRLVEGAFPDYTQVVPKQTNKSVKVSRQELSDALKRVSLLAPDKSFGVRLSFDDGALKIESQNPELGEAQQELGIEYAGPALTVGFNAHYLLDALALVAEGGVRLELTDHQSPALIRPLEAHDFTAVVMPMRV